MSCADCFEWLLEVLIGINNYRPPDGADQETEGENEKNKTEENSDDNKDKSDVPTVDTSHLSTSGADYSFKKHRMKQLFNKHGFNLAIFPGGHVRGVREAFNLHSVLEIISTNQNIGDVQIRAVETGYFLAMDRSGKLYGEEDRENNNTIFVQTTSGPYILYLSKLNAHLGWHVGLKKNGDVKSGRKTAFPWGQKAILFIHRKPYREHHPLKQLRNRLGFTLAIMSDGKVKGVKDADGFNPFTVLEFNPTEPPGAFRIRGVESDLYLAMNKRGWLYGEKDRYNDNCLFAEHTQGHFFIYLSIHWSHLGWHIGIKRSGKVKKGEKTIFPTEQKAIQFIQKFPFPDTSKIGQTGIAGRPLGDGNFPPLAFIDEDG